MFTPKERTVFNPPVSSQLMGEPPVDSSEGSNPLGAFCQIITGLRAISARFTLLKGSFPNLALPNVYPSLISRSLI